VLNRVQLGDDLADDALGQGDQHVGDHDRDGHGRSVVGSPPEYTLQGVGDGRLAERADADRGHRDPDLAGRDIGGDVVELGQGQTSTPHPLLGHLSQPRPPRTHERVLRDHEERVDQYQQRGQDDEQCLHTARPGACRVTAGIGSPAPSVTALLLRDGSSSVMQRRQER
jgi:hypothetical protein